MRSLEALGIRGIPLLKDYLIDRRQRVRIGQDTSDEANMTFGMTLFFIYTRVNTLCNVLLENGRVFSYANDMNAVVFSGDTWESICKTVEKGLARIATWLNSHLLTTNY